MFHLSGRIASIVDIRYLFKADFLDIAEIKSLYSHANARQAHNSQQSYRRPSFKKAGPLAITLAVLGATVAAIFGSVS